MQKHNPTSDDIIWNWVTNIEVCKAYLDICRSAAKHYHEDFEGSVPLTEDQQVVEAYCEYNGGHTRPYWSWVAPKPRKDEPGQWIRDDKVDGMKDRWKKARNYAEAVFHLYKSHPWR
jgi:hypothetical protein